MMGRLCAPGDGGERRRETLLVSGRFGEKRRQGKKRRVRMRRGETEGAMGLSRRVFRMFVRNRDRVRKRERKEKKSEEPRGRDHSVPHHEVKIAARTPCVNGRRLLHGSKAASPPVASTISS